MLITSENATQNSEDKNEFVVSATDIFGLEPFHPTISTNLGTGTNFIAVSKKVVDGDLQFVRYMQHDSKLNLLVFNT